MRWKISTHDNSILDRNQRRNGAILVREEYPVRICVIMVLKNLIYLAPETKWSGNLA